MAAFQFGEYTVTGPPYCPTCDGWGIETLHDERSGRTDHVRCRACGGGTPGGVLDIPDGSERRGIGS